MDKLDIQIQQKKFFKIIFGDVIGEGGNLKDNNYIRIFQNKDDRAVIKFFNNIDELVNYTTSPKIFGLNTYFNLSTTDGEGGTEQNLQTRTVLGFDFDKKDIEGLDAKDIMFKFKSLGLWYHALIDSGNGYHAYMCIEPTIDIKKVEKVTKAIGRRLGADYNAFKTTQVLRVPYSFNIKDKPKRVNIIKMYDRDTIKRYDINKLYNKYCNGTDITEGTINKTITYATNTSKFPPCILKLLEGVEEGNRHFALLRIVSFLKIFKYNKATSWNIIKEWNNKNKPCYSNAELQYQFYNVFDKPYNYSGCISTDDNLQATIKQYCNKEECAYKSKGDIVFIEGESIEIEFKICRSFEQQRKRKGAAFKMKGSHLLIIGLLKNNPSGLTTEEIVNKLTYKDKCALSKPTLLKVLKELSDKGYITKIEPRSTKNGDKTFYKWNSIKCQDVEKFNLSYFAILGAIKGDITPEDLKVYVYIRYRFKDGKNVVQTDLAKDLGVTQQAISKHIRNLMREKYLELEKVDYSINPLGANIYRTNV